MADWVASDAHLDRIHETYWNPATARPTAFRFILCNGTSALGVTNNAAAWTGAQIASGNGYTQNSITFSSHTATVDAAQNRAEGRPTAITVTASGGAIQFDAWAIIATVNGADEIAIYEKFGSTQTINAGENRSFTIEINTGRASADVTAPD